MLDKSAKERTHYVIFQNEKILLQENEGQFFFPRHEEVVSYIAHFKFSQELGFFNGISYYCAEMPKEISLVENFQFFPIKQALERINDNWSSLIVKSVQIRNWAKNHQYCGSCGNKTKQISSILEAHCEPCNMIFYPRISPAIIVLIKKGNKILMARGSHFPEGVYGLIAGFVSPGETIEDSIRREVLEEVGIKIKNIHYFGSQPWPFPDSLMLAFMADYDSGEIKIDDIEIKEAGWYDIDNLPGMPSSSKSIARAMIDSLVTEYS